MYLNAVLLLLPFVGNWQIVKAECEELCLSLPGTEYKPCGAHQNNGNDTTGGDDHEVEAVSCDEEVDFDGTRKWYKLPEGVTDIVITKLSISADLRLFLGHLICSFEHECFTLTLTSEAELPLTVRLKRSVFKIQVLGHKFGFALLSFKAVCDDFYEDYRRYAVVMKKIDSLVCKYKTLSQKTNIGESYKERDLTVIKISNPKTSGPKKTIWIDGGIHAREWISVSTAIYILEQILQNPQEIDKTDFYVMPLINPDGYEYSHTDDRQWRKNRADIKGSKCIGVDLNRNFDFQWGKIGASNDPCNDTYAGPKAFSEVESRITAEYLTKNLKDLDVYLTLHSYGQKWASPWGYTRQKLPKAERDKLDAMGNAAVKAIKTVNQKVFKYDNSAALFGPIGGASDDWSYNRNRNKYSYTVELRDTGRHEFELPKEEIIPSGKEMWKAIQCVNKIVHGKKC